MVAQRLSQCLDRKPNTPPEYASFQNHPVVTKVDDNSSNWAQCAHKQVGLSAWWVFVGSGLAYVLVLHL